MSVKKYRYLFGPVPSRRLGRSLGIDLVPLKTCSFDCIFCQLGRTSKKTVTRKDYVPVDLVFDEIESWLETDGNADYITLSGSGEPTLHDGFGKILDFFSKTSIPSALLTNGTMLHYPEVRDAASRADVVKVSLSAWDQLSFERVNRPHQKLRFSDVLEGQKKFRGQYSGELWLEVFILFGINSTTEDVKKIAALVKEINPDRIQLNTVVRPPAEDFAAALPRDRLEMLTGLFDPHAEIIAEFSTEFTENIQITEDNILSMLQRRPCTFEQIAAVFNLHINEVSKYLGKLMRTNCIDTVKKNTLVYYRAIIKEDRPGYVKKTLNARRIIHYTVKIITILCFALL